MTKHTSRRDFLKGAAATGIAGAAAGMGYWVTGTKTWADELKSKSPNERINIAWVGFGGKGSSDLEQASKHGEIVALCDIDDHIMASHSDKHPKAQQFADYRKMFDKMQKDIDAVGVSTPDHMHAPISMTAITLGKHVYCQKPLTHTVKEARLMREAANKYKVATQMGNQGTAENGLRKAAEFIQAGIIGPVKEVHVWTNRPVWPQSPTITSRPEAKPTPDYIHWDQWIGCAPMRPYSPAYHPFKWRGFWDFGTGALGDMGCHTANLPFMGLKLKHPTAIEAEHEELNKETYPAWAHCTFDFPAREAMPALKFHWYEGHRDGKVLRPPEELMAKVLGDVKPTKGKDGKEKRPELSSSGCFVVGEKGILYSPNDYGASWDLYPKADFKDVQAPPETLPRNGKGDEGMKIEWLAAAKGGPPAMSNFNYAGLLTEFILLGNVAIRAGKRVEFDGEAMKITNDPSLDHLLTEDYREGYGLPKIS